MSSQQEGGPRRAQRRYDWLRITPTQPGWPARLELTATGRERLAAWRAARATSTDGGAA